MIHESGPNQPEGQKSLLLDYEQLAKLTELLVPAEFRQAPPNMDKVRLELPNNDPEDGRRVLIDFISGPAGPLAATASEDKRIDHLNIIVDDSDPDRRPITLRTNDSSVEHMQAETSFYELLESAKEQYPSEVAWSDLAIKALQANGQRNFIDALAAVRRAIPANSDVLQHHVGNQYDWNQAFADGTFVSGILAKGWVQPSLYAYENDVVDAAIDGGIVNFSIRYEGSELHEIKRDALDEQGQLLESMSGMGSEVQAREILTDLRSVLTVAANAGTSTIASFYLK